LHFTLRVATLPQRSHGARGYIVCQHLLLIPIVPFVLILLLTAIRFGPRGEGVLQPSSLERPRNEYVFKYHPSLPACTGLWKSGVVDL